MQPASPNRGTVRGLTSLVIPAYNPGNVAAQTWSEAREFLERAPGEWEIMFVCDGCTDGTPQRLARLIGDTDARMRVLSYSPNRGKGYAVRHGLETARGQWRIFTDVDLAYSFDDILRVAASLRAGAEVAIASRLHPHSRVVLPPSLQGYAYRRHLQSLVFSQLVRLLLPLTQRDTQAGLKGLSAATAERLLPHLSCPGFEFDCELLTACAHFGVPVTEVPVSVRYEDTLSTTRLHNVLRVVRELWKIRRVWKQRLELPVQKPALPQRREAA
jgi:dolichyl-phosphate beta-glucosyltransferase